jgi:transposase InsO family protein
MIDAFSSLLSLFTVWLKTRVDLRAENLMLRYQLDVLRRSIPKRVRMTKIDRLIFVWLYRLWPASIGAIRIIHPKTLIRWHREGFRLYWRWKSRPRNGRPRVSAELRALIRQMSQQNPLWGAPRIHGELLKLGFDISEATVSRYLPRRPCDPDQRWKTFVANHRHCMASIDFLVVPTVTFKLLFILVVLNHRRRELVHLAVTPNPTAAWTAQQMREAFPWDDAPRYVIHDRHRTFGKAFRRRVQAMGITPVPTAPRSPWQNGHVERVIGSLRRECLDHIIVVNERHLRRVLGAYLAYYNRTRTHLALSKDAPVPRAMSPPTDGNIIAIPQLGGLHHRYERRAA